MLEHFRSKKMRATPVVGVAALALAACQAEDTATDNETETTVLQDDSGTDLNMDSSAFGVDQAVNQTDAQSDLGETVDNAADSAGNEM
jgi:uncharacterized protein YcfL